MIQARWTRILTPLLLAVCLFVTACGGVETTTSPGTSPATQTQAAAQTLKGGAFNRYFPQASGDYRIVFSQEKTGFAQAKLQQGSQEVALLSVSDTANNPNAVAKFQESNQRIAGYPAMTQGRGTAILVADRFQVKVQSRVDSFTTADQKSWLEKFNLSGISSLK